MIIAAPAKWGEKFAEDALVKEGMPRYLKAKTIGENFAREITS